MAEPIQNENAARALDIVRQLEESGALGTGGRLPALLRYLVSEELAGRGERLKAYAIATDVLGRGKAFDPAQDSIVRVEVARLRRALDYYYATSGSAEDIRITIPRGGYRPLIGPALPGADDDALEAEAPETRESPAQRPAWLRPLVTLGALALLVAALYYLIGPRLGPPSVPQRPAYSAATPRLVLLPITASDDASAALAPGLRAQIAAILAQHAWLAVSVEDQFNPTGTLAPKLFSLAMVLTRESGVFTLRTLLNSEPDHRVVWNGRYDSATLHQPVLEMASKIAGDLGRDLGYPLGPIGQAVAARSGETAPEVEDRFLCMMNAYRYWRALEPKQRSDALACLERLSARFPDFTEGRAMLAMFALEAVRTPGATNRASALTQAESLLRGAPDNDRLSLTARMLLNACKGDVPATQKAARALYVLAPNDPDTLAEVANAAGMAALDWKLSLEAEARAFELASVPHARYAHAKAAKLLLDGDYEGALTAISRVPQTNLAKGQMMVLALATLADAPLRAQSAADALAMGFSSLPDALFERIDNACWHGNVKKAYRSALTYTLEHRAPPCITCELSPALRKP